MENVLNKLISERGPTRLAHQMLGKVVASEQNKVNKIAGATFPILVAKFNLSVSIDMLKRAEQTGGGETPRANSGVQAGFVKTCILVTEMWEWSSVPVLRNSAYIVEKELAELGRFLSSMDFAGNAEEVEVAIRRLECSMLRKNTK